MKEAEEEEEEEARPVHAKPSVINPSRVDREKEERAASQSEQQDKKKTFLIRVVRCAQRQHLPYCY